MPFQLEISLDYGGDVRQFQQLVASLREKYRSKTSFHYEEDLKAGLSELLSVYSRSVFDKTRIKSLNEVALLPPPNAAREF